MALAKASTVLFRETTWAIVGVACCVASLALSALL